MDAEKKTEQQRSRGKYTEADLTALRRLPLPKLYTRLDSECAAERTAAVHLLGACSGDAHRDDILLAMLAGEPCLYTRLEICGILADGGEKTIRNMLKLMGKIGDNQYRDVPEKSSQKKSYPLPRDIIARILGRISPRYFDILLEHLMQSTALELSELLDAIGFLVFYHPELASEQAVAAICSAEKRFFGNRLILWKLLTCLSAFPTPSSRKFLLHYAKESGILGLEAQRSLRILEARGMRK